MNILIVGDWHSELHEEALFQSFKAIGHQVERFSWHEYFQPVRSGCWEKADVFFKKFQNKYLVGPLLRCMNKDFIAAAVRTKPDAIFVYRGTHIQASALRQVKRCLPDTILVGYNNDDPFNKGHHAFLWRLFNKAIPEYDLILAYRHHNIDDFRRAGAKQVDLLRSWYIPERNFPLNLAPEDQKRYGCEVVFIGHYEEDGRREMFEAIVRAGFDFKLFGPGHIGWDKAICKSAELKSFVPVKLVWGQDYNKAINGAKIAICFLSKLNRDTYTRRCFEIPASGTLLLSEYTDDLATLYTPGVEADFFTSQAELLGKLDKYLKNDKLREKVAAAGHARAAADGHDVYSRAREVTDLITRLQAGGPIQKNAFYTRSGVQCR